MTISVVAMKATSPPAARSRTVDVAGEDLEEIVNDACAAHDHRSSDAACRSHEALARGLPRNGHGFRPRRAGIRDRPLAASPEALAAALRSAQRIVLDGFLPGCGGSRTGASSSAGHLHGGCRDDDQPRRRWRPGGPASCRPSFRAPAVVEHLRIARLVAGAGRQEAAPLLAALLGRCRLLGSGKRLARGRWRPAAADEVGELLRLQRQQLVSGLGRLNAPVAPWL
jgi:hypothetical protein